MTGQLDLGAGIIDHQPLHPAGLEDRRDPDPWHEQQRQRALELARQATRREFTITCVRLSDMEHRGRRYWTARVTAGGVTVSVDRMHGSWQALVGTGRREVLPHIAAALQRKIPA